VYLLTAAAILALGLWYRVAAWPALGMAADSTDYATMASTAIAAGRYVIMPWRTPGYALSLTWLYRLAGLGNLVAVHAWQIGLSLLTAVLVGVVTRRVTGSWALALVALLIAALAWPMAAPSAFLMTEAQAMLLATLAVFLVLAIHAGRHAGAAALALGPAAALAYETRPALLPWVAPLVVVALVARTLRWRQRAVLVLGGLLVLAPVVVANAQSQYRVLTAGPAVDLVSENLAVDRYSLYWTAPNSPALLEQLYAATVADGGDTDYWLTRPPAQVAGFMSARLRGMEWSILGDAWPYARLSLRRAPLLFRYDQPWDMTYPVRLTAPELLLVDLLLALAVVGLSACLWRRRWLAAAVLGAPLVALTGFLALFHVEPRYSLPALPVVVVLAMLGLRVLVELLAPRDGPGRRRRLALGAALTAAVVLAAPLSEAWFWPSLVDDYAPRPAAAAHEVASCYVGHQLLTAVAWQPGTSLVVAGGVNGMAAWDVRGRACPWQSLIKDNVWDLGFSRDATRLAVGSYHARILDTRSWTPYRPPVLPGPLTGVGTEILSVSLDPAGDRLAFAATGLDFVGVYDTAGRAVATTATVSASPVAVRWSPDGSTVAVATADGMVRLLDAGLRPLRALRLPDRPTVLAWSPSGRTLAAGDADGAVALIDASGPIPRVLASRAAHRGTVHGVAFSPDGESLATAAADGLTRIWDAGTLSPTMSLPGDTAAVWGVQWSADSSRVVTASADGSLGVWAVR
jgi:DNA-binding beta-propeller fold protein YncE